jgi:[acyl-carrier-protein] S-malonyltransferase
MRAAADLTPDATFVEVGPGSVLSGLLKRIVPGARTVTLGTADEVERFVA